jgi:hypothetical protein
LGEKNYCSPNQSLIRYYLPLNIDAIQIIIAITTITAIMPTTAPALNMPAIAEQLLRHSISRIRAGKYKFFMGRLF